MLHPYWTRVWILQEIVLAQWVVLVTSSGSFSWDTVASVSSLLIGETQETWSAPSSHVRPSKSGLWALKEDGYIPWVSITRPAILRKSLRFLSETSSSHPFMPWHFALRIATDYAATDPRDHIYGLLGVMGLEIEPDYTSKTTADVFRDFASSFLKASRNMPITGRNPEHPFRFLAFAGIGRHEYEPGVPTWAPNFPQEYRRPLEILVPAYCQRAGKGVFLETAGYATVTGNSLYAPGVLFEQIGRVSTPPSEEEDIDMRFLSIIPTYLARYKTYVSGIPTLQAFFRLALRDVSMHVKRTTVSDAFGFLRVLLARVGTEHVMASLLTLGCPVNRESERAGQAMGVLPAEDLHV